MSEFCGQLCVIGDVHECYGLRWYAVTYPHIRRCLSLVMTCNKLCYRVLFLLFVFHFFPVKCSLSVWFHEAIKWMLQSRSGQPPLERRRTEVQITTQGCSSSGHWQRCRTASNQCLDVHFQRYALCCVILDVTWRRVLAPKWKCHTITSGSKQTIPLRAHISRIINYAITQMYL